MAPRIDGDWRPKRLEVVTIPLNMLRTLIRPIPPRNEKVAAIQRPYVDWLGQWVIGAIGTDCNFLADREIREYSPQLGIVYASRELSANNPPSGRLVTDNLRSYCKTPGIAAIGIKSVRGAPSKV